MKNKFIENTQQSIIDTPSKVEVKKGNSIYWW